MFDTIRDNKKYLMGFLLILIIPGFVLFGVQGLGDSNQGSEKVASVDGQKITRDEWDQAHRTEAQQLMQANPTLDSKFLDSDEVRFATLDRLVRDRVLSVAATKLHLLTSDQHLARALQEDPNIAALRRADGTLDVEAYTQLVGRQGMTPAMYEARLRDDLSKRQVVAGVVGTGFTLPAQANLALDAYFQQREVRVQRFAATDFTAQVKPTEAEIEAFYKDNSAQFQAPEQADVQYVVLDAAALQKNVTLDAANVKSYYDQNASRLSGPEERRASHILLTAAASAPEAEKEKVRQKAQALLAQVRKAPETFAAVATAESQDPGSAAKGGDLDFFGRGAMVKPFEDTVFSLEKGAISDVVETDFGFHIIQLTDIKAPKTRTFEEMRPEIEADLKQQEAQKLFLEASESFGNLIYEQSDSLQPAADRLKLEIKTLQGVTRQAGPQAGPLNNARMLTAIFGVDAVQNKRNTEAIEIAPGQLASARIVKYQPARTRPLAEVRDSVNALLTARRSAELANEAGFKQLEAFKGGADASAMAATITVARDKPQGLSATVLRAVMSADTKTLPAWVGVKLDGQGYAVVKIEKTLPRASGAGKPQGQEVQQYTQWLVAAEGQAYYEVLRERYKVKILVPEPRR
ncbi:SurA N-terminal domain-containing protein [Hydrogenophaga sp. PAMC20947]|uniref:SurA N-terminal domain-containing protein n=1 Tax=Hydrogenophaga sp. PAMC20947 TaxID=2565558 RepID=UPI00109DE81B|nr:SurA N-terminal domain-containing protein [Hydrogenophaga sp. PAMC20947]QCB45867.1 peptidyl-prolyl cis-trans isomerase [Hydrogenophaga sp. PAMC20947]